MARLVWGTPGERFYEAGVDRGVLFPQGGAGVAWNGLTAVRETPSGGEPKPYYIDGFKYVSVSAAEEFAATLEAFSSPAEFAACDGTVAINNGLFATQQPRKPFALCYRTRVGNDVDGADHGYKLHLVYNALAAPSERANATIGETTEATMLSWAIATAPPRVGGMKPTAHFVVDSRKTPKLLMATLEDILYGTDAVNSRLILAQELVDLFRSPGPVVRRNLINDPVSSTTTSTSRWRISGGEVSELIPNDGGLPAIEARDDVGGGAVYIDPNQNFLVAGNLGKWYAFGADVKIFDQGTLDNFAFRISPYNGASVVPNTNPYNPSSKDYARQVASIQVSGEGSGGYIRALIWPGGSGNLAKDPSMLDPTKWSSLPTGTTFGGAGTGMDGATEGSILISGSTTQDGVYAGTHDLANLGIPVMPGQKVAVSAWVRGAALIPISSARVYVRFYDLTDPKTTVSMSFVSNPTDLAANTWAKISGVVDAPATSVGQLVAVPGVYKQPTMTNTIRWSTLDLRHLQRFRLRNAVFAMADTKAEAEAMVALPLSGDMQNVGGMTYEWEGTPNNSPSVARTWGD